MTSNEKQLERIEKAVSALPALYATEEMNAADKDCVKIFGGSLTWVLTEFDPIERRAFGWADLGFGPGCSEWGYVMLDDIKSVRVLGIFALEVDRHVSTVAEAGIL